MVSVLVAYKSTGKPASGVKVSIGFDGFTRGFSRDEYTDSDGLAHFDNEPGRGTVYVSGSRVHEGQISGKTVVYI